MNRLNQNEETIVSVIWSPKNKCVELHLNMNGVDEFIEILQKLKKMKSPDYIHLMSPELGGDTLTIEKRINPESELIHHLILHIWDFSEKK